MPPQVTRNGDRGKLTEAAEETLRTSVSTYSAVLHLEYQTLKVQHPAW